MLETERRTDERPASAPNPPDEDRLKLGCCGRLAEFMSDMRECWEVYGGFKAPMELVRFMADEGCGREEKFWTLPRVCAIDYVSLT